VGFFNDYLDTRRYMAVREGCGKSHVTTPIVM